MHEHVTLLPPEAHSDERGLSSSLPADLLEQVRGRVRLLALLLLVAFTHTRKQVCHAVPEGTHRAIQPAGPGAG